MDFQEKLVQVLYNLIPVLQVVSGQLSQLMSEELHMPKGIRIAEQSPVAKFELGPFERADDHFYRNHRYLKAVNWKNKKIRERIAGFRDEKQQREGKKTEEEEISKWKSIKGNSQQQKIRLDGVQTKPMHSTASEEPESGFVQRIGAIRNDIEKIKALSDLLTEIKAEVQKMETALTVEPFEKLLTVLEKSFSARENQNEFRPISGINNITYINQYQIENVFAINRLSGRTESKPKGADAQITTELTAHKMNEASEKAVNYLKGGAANEHPSLPQTDMELLDQLQRNFSRTFSHQNVSLEQMNQMSKIIDFVERYHGAVGSLKQSSGKERSRTIGGVQGRVAKTRWKQQLEGKVLCDEGLGSLGSEEEKRPVTRRKGSVK